MIIKAKKAPDSEYIREDIPPKIIDANTHRNAVMVIAEGISR